MKKKLLQILTGAALVGTFATVYSHELTPGDSELLQEWVDWDIYRGELPESLINFINNPTVVSNNPGYRESAEIKALLEGLNQHLQSKSGQDLQKELSATEYQKKLEAIQDIMQYF